jgi:hypothetical protein
MREKFIPWQDITLTWLVRHSLSDYEHLYEVIHLEYNDIVYTKMIEGGMQLAYTHLISATPYLTFVINISCMQLSKKMSYLLVDPLRFPKTSKLHIPYLLKIQ